MAHERTDSYLKDSISLFQYYKRLGENAVAQCPDEGLVALLDDQSNSIATIVKHLSGICFRDGRIFLPLDGEKPTRDRDAEFEKPPKNRARFWICGTRMEMRFHGAARIADSDMTKTVEIRGEKHSVMQAINRQVAHYNYHIRQSAAGEALRGRELEVPQCAEEQSKEFNADVASGRKSQR